MGTGALEQQPTAFSSSALSFDYPRCPPLHFHSLPACEQRFVCLSVAFWFSTAGTSEAQKRKCARAQPERVRMPAQRRDRVSINFFSVFPPVCELETIFHLPKKKKKNYTAASSNESPLSSASTALGYSGFHALPNGFSNAGTRFLSRLDRHFPLCLEMGIRPWVVHRGWCCWKILHTE